MTKEQWKLRLGMYRTGMIDFEDIHGVIEQELAKERERAGKLVEALNTIISQNECCKEDYVISKIIKTATEALTEYENSKI